MFSNIDYQRNEFHKAMQRRDEIRKTLEENSLASIKTLHEKNNERIHHIRSILKEEAKYLWGYCNHKCKCFDPVSTDVYSATMSHNIVIYFDGKYESALLEFDIIHHENEDKFEVYGTEIHYDGLIYEFYEKTFNPTANILDYADSIKEQSEHIGWLEGGVEDMFQSLTAVAKKDIECLMYKNTI